MNELDQFIKHKLHIKHYVRYTDDFAIASSDRAYLEGLIEPISIFLGSHLSLVLHPNKVSIRKLHQGVDFLGYVIFPHHRLVRTKTRRRMFKKMRRRAREYQEGIIDRLTFEQSLQSYIGVMSHANAFRLVEEMGNLFWFIDQNPN
jgi:RNA-directed DNA polymerase